MLKSQTFRLICSEKMMNYYSLVNSNIKLNHFLKPVFEHFNISDFIVIFKLIETISIKTFLVTIHHQFFQLWNNQFQLVENTGINLF